MSPPVDSLLIGGPRSGERIHTLQHLHMLKVPQPLDLRGYGYGDWRFEHVPYTVYERRTCSLHPMAAKVDFWVATGTTPAEVTSILRKARR